MKRAFSRRDLGWLLPLMAGTAAGQTETLPSKNYRTEQIPYTGDERKKGRRFFYGKNHSGFALEMHETVLGPGVETHPPHKHQHEEVVLVVEGSVESYLEGKRETVEAGSVLYFGSNQMHCVKNVGTGPCRYYILELRG
jgi:quercetin dioxygenase-like cupin family protein